MTDFLEMLNIAQERQLDAISRPLNSLEFQTPGLLTKLRTVTFFSYTVPERNPDSSLLSYRKTIGCRRAL